VGRSGAGTRTGLVGPAGGPLSRGVGKPDRPGTGGWPFAARLQVSIQIVIVHESGPEGSQPKATGSSFYLCTNRERRAGVRVRARARARARADKLVGTLTDSVADLGSGVF
jgi:hypothetical protein